MGEPPRAARWRRTVQRCVCVSCVDVVQKTTVTRCLNRTSHSLVGPSAAEARVGGAAGLQNQFTREHQHGASALHQPPPLLFVRPLFTSSCIAPPAGFHPEALIKLTMKIRFLHEAASSAEELWCIVVALHVCLSGVQCTCSATRSWATNSRTHIVGVENDS